MPTGGDAMAKLRKPASVATDPFRSAKWDEICDGRDFKPSDVPTIALLVQWYQVIERCMDDIATGDGVQVAYQNDVGDIKALPQLATMKQASAEIRAINKQLGINDEARKTSEITQKASVLSLVIGDRQRKAEHA